MAITIYIPCHNAGRFIARCLDSLLMQSLKATEVVVIDDGSTDDTVRIASAYPVRIYSLSGHPGLGAARHEAIQQATTEYIASVDADCVADTDWLSILADAMQTRGCDGVGGRLIETYCKNTADMWRTVHMPQHWGDSHIESPPFLFGCNTLFRRSALLAVGSYRQRHKTNGEDVDISRRLTSAGYTLCYEPHAVVRHLKRDSMWSVLETDWRWGYQSTGEVMKYECARNILYHNYLNMRYRFSQDVHAARYRLLLLDTLLFAAHTYWDLSYARRNSLLQPTHTDTEARSATFTEYKRHLNCVGGLLLEKRRRRTASASSLLGPIWKVVKSICTGRITSRNT